VCGALLNSVQLRRTVAALLRLGIAQNALSHCIYALSHSIYALSHSIYALVPGPPTSSVERLFFCVRTEQLNLNVFNNAVFTASCSCMHI
jgi:hypothetical protein